ncbi:hypothetical protein DIJ61_31550, partial [Burkholderia pseudomallei]
AAPADERPADARAHSAAIALFFTLLGGGMGARVGGPFIGGRGGRGGGNDGFRGGGGGFGGGGASGRW